MKKISFFIFIFLVMVNFANCKTETAPDSSSIGSGIITSIPESVYSYGNSLGDSKVFIKNTISSGEGTQISGGIGGLFHIKNSWSKTGDWITFMNVKYAPADAKYWESVITIAKPDGSEFRTVSVQGRYFNPTWLRNRNIVFFFKMEGSDASTQAVYASKIAASVNTEVKVSDPAYSEYGLTSFNDGRILISSNRSGTKKYYLFQMNIDSSGNPMPYSSPTQYTLVTTSFTEGSLPAGTQSFVRESVSPDGTQIAFEADIDGSGWTMYDTHLCIADFNMSTATMSNARIILPITKTYIANYTKWSADGKSIIYVSNETGYNQLFSYYISTGEIRRISNTGNKSYSYFSAKNTPN